MEVSMPLEGMDRVISMIGVKQPGVGSHRFEGMLRSSTRVSRTSPHASVADQQRSIVKRPPRRLLRKSDLEDKLLITRTSGRQLGVVGEAWVEPRRLLVQAFDVANKAQLLKTELSGCVPLSSVKEVGDVVLIHSEQDFKSGLSQERWNWMTVPGLKLVMDKGRVLGRCVDFVFDPQSGRIAKLVFHTVNLGFAKKGWFDQYAVSVQHVSRIVMSERVVYLKDEATWNKVAAGEYQFLANLMPSFDAQADTEPMLSDDGWGGDDLQQQYRQLLDESRKQQQAYYDRYGQQRESPQRTTTRMTRRDVRERSNKPTAKPRPESIRMDDWLKKEANREGLFME